MNVIYPNLVLFSILFLLTLNKKLAGSTDSATPTLLPHSIGTPAICDSGTHLVSLLLCTAITYIQGTTYKIILYINNEERVHRSHNLPEEREKTLELGRQREQPRKKREKRKTGAATAQKMKEENRKKNCMGQSK